MYTSRRMVCVIGGLVAVAFATGCADDSRDMQIRKLQEENQALHDENGKLTGDLAMAGNENENMRRRLLELQDMLDKAQRQPPIASSSLPPGWTGTEEIAWMNIAEDILFDSGKADVKSSGKSKLTEIVSQIRSSFPNYDVFVVGHTDTDPINKSRNQWKDNLDLSVNRGAAVVRELQKSGINPQKLYAAGAGEHHPRMTNSTKAGKQANRRVQIIALKIPMDRTIDQPTTFEDTTSTGSGTK